MTRHLDLLLMNIPIKGVIMSAVNLEFAISDLIKVHIIILKILFC